MMDHLPDRTLVLDFKNVLYIDSSGADTLMDLHRACRKRDVYLVTCGLLFQPLDILRRCGFVAALGEANIANTMPQALEIALTYGIAPPASNPNTPER